MRVNWKQTIEASVRDATAAGGEANITQARNVINDLCRVLVTRYASWEILEGIYRLSGLPQKRGHPQSCCQKKS